MLNFYGTKIDIVQHKQFSFTLCLNCLNLRNKHLKIGQTVR